MTRQKAKTPGKRQLRTILIFAIVILLNIAGAVYHFRLDLTADKRFTLSPVTKEFLRSMNEPVEVRVYLSGDVNAGFRNLEKSVSDLLKEFTLFSDNQLKLTFINLDNTKDKTQIEFYKKEIETLGLEPINIVDESNKGEVLQKTIFPWAVVQKGEKRIPVHLLVNKAGLSGEENLNASIETLEYGFIEALLLLNNRGIRKIAFLEGHNELPYEQVYDATEALSRYFQVDRGSIGNDPNVLKEYEVVIIAQPQNRFSESEKFILDQYLMDGGKVLWLIDGVEISMDSLSDSPQTVGLLHDINIGDMLFNYGVRVNHNLVQDLQCALYPVNFASPGQTPNFRPVPWYFSPLLFPQSNHPVTRSISPVKAEFISSLDTVSVNGLSHTILLSTSGKSNVFQAPVKVDLAMSASQVKSSDFIFPQQIGAVLIEGEFRSVFRNRAVPQIFSGAKLLRQSRPTAMIVVSDGDVIRNDVQGSGNQLQVYPLGFDRFTRQHLFGNRDFIVNCVNYLTDDIGLMQLRSKKITLRLLNKEQSNEKRVKWQIINTITPLILLLIFSLVFVFLRYRKNVRRYTK
jgi:ABC-2 type transport system permease protein